MGKHIQLKTGPTIASSVGSFLLVWIATKLLDSLAVWWSENVFTALVWAGVPLLLMTLIPISCAYKRNLSSLENIVSLPDVEALEPHELMPTLQSDLDKVKGSRNALRVERLITRLTLLVYGAIAIISLSAAILIFLAPRL